MNFSPITNTPEYAFLNENPHLGNNIILLGYGGSTAYGTNLPTSDTDIRGVALRTKSEILLGKDYETVVDTPTDTTIYSFDKMLGLLSECNPNCIEILGLKPEHYLYVTDIGRRLLDNKNIFLSKRCIHTFGGYATQQLYRLRQKSLNALSPTEYNAHIVKVIEGIHDHLKKNFPDVADNLHIRQNDTGLVFDFDKMTDIPAEEFEGIANEVSAIIRTYNKNSSRNNKAMAHAKIHKHAMHLIRLYMMCVDLLETGEIITYRANEHDTLMKIRNGEMLADDGMLSQEFWDLLASWEARFNEAQTKTELPDNPDFAAIEKLRYEINESIVTK